MAAAVLIAVLAAAVSWLDDPVASWEQRGGFPRAQAGAEPFAALDRRCGSSALADSAAAAALRKGGWVPFLHLDRTIAREDIEVVGGMSAANPGCVPDTFNLFVFAGGRFIGVLSPVVMTPNRDGAAGAVRITGADTLTTEFARYASTDTECCPSSRVRVTYRIDRAGQRPLVAIDSRQIR